MLTFCSDKKNDADKVFQEHLLKLGDIYPLIELEGWSLVYDIKHQDLTYYKGEKIYGDTIEVLAFFYNANEDVNVDIYLKKVLDGQFVHNIVIEKDTLFYFIEDTLTLTKNFIVGKYNYLWKYGELDSEEYDYYILHKDSLGKVRGNNIIPLPRTVRDLSDSLPGV